MKRSRPQCLEGDQMCGFINRRLLPVKVHMFLNLGALAGVMPFIVLHARSLGISAGLAGTANAAMLITSIFLKFYLGTLADKFRAVKPILVLVILLQALFHIILYTCVPRITSLDAWNVVSGQDERRVFSPKYEYRTVCSLNISEPTVCEQTVINSTFLSSCPFIDADYYRDHGCTLEARIGPPSALWTWQFWLFMALRIGSGGLASVGFSLTDTATFAVLADRKELFGRQRLWGTISWGGLAPLIGLVNEHFSSADSHNYAPGFVINFILSVLDAVAVALFLRVPQQSRDATPTLASTGHAADSSDNETVTEAGTSTSRSTPAKDSNEASSGCRVCADCGATGLSAVDNDALNGGGSRGGSRSRKARRDPCSRCRSSGSIVAAVGRVFRQPAVFFFTLSVFVQGTLISPIWSYSFWYFHHELGASQRLLGLQLTVQCFLGEVPFMFFAGWLIGKLGFRHSLELAIGATALRLGLYAVGRDAWLMLPIEVLHGLSFGLFYTAMTLYASRVALPGTEASVQGIISGMFEGAGIAVGSVVCGFLFDHVGERTTLLMFTLYGAGFLVIQVIVNIVLGDAPGSVETSQNDSSFLALGNEKQGTRNEKHLF